MEIPGQPPVIWSADRGTQLIVETAERRMELFFPPAPTTPFSRQSSPIIAIRGIQRDVSRSEPTQLNP